MNETITNKPCVIILMTILMIIVFSGARSEAQVFSYGDGCIDGVLTSTGDILYVTLNIDDAIVEIDTSTMMELRRFAIVQPTFMVLSPDGEYLYTVCSDPGKLVRIRLSDSQINEIPLEGEGTGLFLEANGERLWVVHRTWPLPGDLAGIEFVGGHLNTGLLTEVNTVNFSVNTTISINEVPMSVWYSEFSNKIYVIHEDFWYSSPDWENADELANIITIYTSNAGSLQNIGWMVGGMTDASLGTAIPNQVSSWSDDGRYLVVPCASQARPDYSLRVIDTIDDSVFLDITLHGNPIGNTVFIKYVQKIPGVDILWCAVRYGVPEGMSGSELWMARINISTLEYEFYPVPQGKLSFGDFAVDSDCDTLYLTQPWTGEVIVWTAPNTEPVCSLLVVTLMPHIGDGVIEFDATESYDPDPCDELTFEWDFDGDLIFNEPIDDSYTGPDNNPTHTYTDDYHGPVFLRLTDSDDLSNMCTVEVQVRIE